MRISPDGIVCGVRAARLKSLLRKPDFHTPDAMRSFGLNEPDVTKCLLNLAAEGWITYRGRQADKDTWEPTPQGARLAATSILKRIPVARGEAILERVLEEARSINRDPQRSCRITAIYLFGSLLTGTDDGTIGDVDIVVETARRQLPPHEMTRLEDAERCGESWGPRYWSRGSNLIKMQLKRVARAVSIHEPMDLELPGVRFRQVFAFDPARDEETNFDPSERVHAKPRRGAAPTHDTRAKQFERHARDWPKSRRHHSAKIEHRDGLVAQHLWQNGLALDDIARRVPASAERIEAYLASCAFPMVKPGPIHPCLAATIASCLPPNATFELAADVRITRRSSTVWAYAYVPDAWERCGSVLHDRRGGPFISEARPDVVHALLAAASAAAEWRDKIKSRAAELNVLIQTSVLPGEPVSTNDATYPDFRTLAMPMQNALGALLSSSQSEDEAVELVVTANSPGKPRIRMRRRSHGRESYKAIPDHLATPISEKLDELEAAWASLLKVRTVFEISLSRWDLEE